MEIQITSNVYYKVRKGITGLNIVGLLVGTAMTVIGLGVHCMGVWGLGDSYTYMLMQFISLFALPLAGVGLLILYLNISSLIKRIRTTDDAEIFARLKKNMQYRVGKIEKIKFCATKGDSHDSCIVYVRTDDMKLWQTPTWLTLDNLLTKELVSKQDEKGMFTITDESEIASIGRDAYIYSDGNGHNYMEMDSGDTLARAIVVEVKNE